MRLISKIGITVFIIGVILFSYAMITAPHEKVVTSSVETTVSCVEANDCNTSYAMLIVFFSVFGLVGGTAMILYPWF